MAEDFLAVNAPAQVAAAISIIRTSLLPLDKEPPEHQTDLVLHAVTSQIAGITMGHLQYRPTTSLGASLRGLGISAVSRELIASVPLLATSLAGVGRAVWPVWVVILVLIAIGLALLLLPMAGINDVAEAALRKQLKDEIDRIKKKPKEEQTPEDRDRLKKLIEDLDRLRG